MSADILDWLRENSSGHPSHGKVVELGRLAEAAAEIGRRRGEVEELKTRRAEDISILDDIRDAIGGGPYDTIAKRIRKAIAPAEAKDPAPAMPNGGEASREQFNAWMKTRGVISSWHVQQDMWNAWTASRAADNRDAAGVVPAWIATWMADREILPDDDGDGISEGALVEALNNHERELLNAIPKAPAAVPAGEANADAPAGVLEHLIFSVDRVANSGDYGLCDQAVVQLNYAIEDARRGIGTGTPQPADGEASMFAGQSDAQIAHAVRMAEQHYRSLGRDPVYCNVSLSVLRDCTPPAPVQAAPQEGEAVGEVVAFGSADLKEVAWRKGKMPPTGTKLYAHPSACDLGAVRKLQRWDIGYTQFGASIQRKDNGTFVKLADVEAALQHRGDSRGGEGSGG